VSGRRKWHLESAVERAADAGPSFEIPPPEIRATIKVGEIAKLLFWLDSGSGPVCERMWVEVVEETEAGYIGKLMNEAQTPGVIEPDTLVAFTPDHVAAVWDYR
jgi:uncharacterized protein YegJ (DUF2314 family)